MLIKKILVKNIDWDLDQNSITLQCPLNYFVSADTIDDYIKIFINHSLMQYSEINGFKGSYESYSILEDETSYFMLTTKTDILLFSSEKHLVDHLETLRKDDESLNYFDNYKVENFISAYFYFKDNYSPELISLSRFNTTDFIYNKIETIFKNENSTDICFFQSDLQFSKNEIRKFYDLKGDFSCLDNIYNKENDIHPLFKMFIRNQNRMLSYDFAEEKDKIVKQLKTVSIGMGSEDIMVIESSGEIKRHFTLYRRGETFKLIYNVDTNQAIINNKDTEESLYYGDLFVEDLFLELKPIKNNYTKRVITKYEYEMTSDFFNMCLFFKDRFFKEHNVLVEFKVEYKEQILTLNFNRIDNLIFIRKVLPKLREAFVETFHVDLKDKYFNDFMGMLDVFLQDEHKELNLIYILPQGGNDDN